MKLFKYDNWELSISEEALCIKAFAVLFKRDRTVNKDRAKQELGFIYFAYDPRSDYMYIVDEQERIDIIKEQEGLDSKWHPDKSVLEAIEVYKSLTQTTSSLLLEDTRFAIAGVRKFLRDLDLSIEDEKGKPKYTINTVISAINQIPDLSEKLRKAEEALNKELEENGKMRGQKQKKLFEDGLMLNK